MRLNRNYFLLYHGITLDEETPMFIDEKIDDETFFELAALFLGVNQKNFSKMKVLENFKKLVLLLTSQSIETIESMYHLQFSIIEHFMESRSMRNVQHLHSAFSYLLEEKILKRQEYDKLISLFDPTLFEEKSVNLPANMSENFHTNKEAFTVSLKELLEITKKEEELAKIQEYLNAQHFSIGITGVMNAGKSTMLNALMGEEILGTSIVPETANLTVVKYAPEPYAEVVYWDEMQWSKIQKSALTSEAMASFVQETELQYAQRLHKYILPTALREKIDIDELANFTSAAAEDKRSNLVSHVELRTPLHFLQDGIEIVDTPGLDDVVVQREEITKEYIAQCDLMIHLMNVSQSATQKDVEFIIDALLYQNVTKLLIVITRADLVSDKELQEVIEYTKRSISSQLHEQNSGSKLDFILQNLHFIALSGKMALLHKTGRSKEAEKEGFTLQQSGITQIESYLDETLFGKDAERSSLIMHSAKKQLKKFITEHLEALTFELSLLGKNEDELSEYLDEMQLKKEHQQTHFKELSVQLKAYEEETKTYLNSLTFFLDNKLLELQEIIKRRLLDETLYNLKKEKKPAQKRRITLIIDTALKHGIVDILREYRYKFAKKTKQISSALEHQYADMGIYIKEIETDALGNGFLTQSFTTLHETAQDVLKDAKLKNLSTIESRLKESIKEAFSDISDMIKRKAKDTADELLSEFFVYLAEPIRVAKEKLETHEQLVCEHIKYSQKDETLKENRQVEILKEMKLVEDVLKRCSL